MNWLITFNDGTEYSFHGQYDEAVCFGCAYRDMLGDFSVSAS